MFVQLWSHHCYCHVICMYCIFRTLSQTSKVSNICYWSRPLHKSYSESAKHLIVWEVFTTCFTQIYSHFIHVTENCWGNGMIQACTTRPSMQPEAWSTWVCYGLTSLFSLQQFAFRERSLKFLNWRSYKFFFPRSNNLDCWTKWFDNTDYFLL